MGVGAWEGKQRPHPLRWAPRGPPTCLGEGALLCVYVVPGKSDAFLIFPGLAGEGLGIMMFFFNWLDIWKKISFWSVIF